MAGTSPQARQIADAIVQSLAQLRRKKGYSQRKLAMLANISQSGLLLIERGDRRPTLDILLQLAQALDTDLWRLLRQAEGRAPAES